MTDVYKEILCYPPNLKQSAFVPLPTEAYIYAACIPAGETYFHIAIIIIIIIIIYFMRAFHISVSWWSFTRVWVTASLLKSPGLFSVFWPISIMQ